MKIVQAPHDVLAKQAQPVEKIDKTIKKLLADMEETLVKAHDPEGVGLAAPQVNKSLQIFIVQQSPDSPLLICINPVIEQFLDNPHTSKQKKDLKKAKSVQLEGCLSLKDVWGVVERKHGVVLSYMDEHGVRHKKTFTGFIATIIQHEVDHLNGILFPKRVLEQHNSLYHSIKNAKGEIEFEEIAI